MNERQQKFLRRIAGVSLLVVLIAFATFKFIVFVTNELGRASELARLASCRPSLIMSASLRFAEENDRMFPPLSPVRGRFTYDTDVCGQYTHSVSDHICDSGSQGPTKGSLRDIVGSDKIDDWSYVYFGYFIENEKQAFAFMRAYAERVIEGEDFEDDLFVGNGNGNCGGDTLYRLRSRDAVQDVPPCLRDKAAAIPVVIEWPGNHKQPGGKVVYLDDHTDYVRYPGPFPMTESFIERLRELDFEFSGAEP